MLQTSIAFLTKQIEKSETSLSMGSDYYALGAAVTAIAAILSQWIFQAIEMKLQIFN